MKSSIKSCGAVLCLSAALYSPIILADPKPDSPAYEHTDIASLKNSEKAHEHSPVFASPIPEANTYVMMLVGLGLVGFMVYRRSNS